MPIRHSAEFIFYFMPLPTFPIIRSLFKIFLGNSIQRSTKKVLRTISSKWKNLKLFVAISNIRQTNTVSGSKPQSKRDTLFIDIGLSGPNTTRWERRLSFISIFPNHLSHKGLLKICLNKFQCSVAYSLWTNM